MGSLVAALGSFLNVRHQHGDWLVRIDNIDQARSIKNMDSIILTTLDHHGLHWDGPVYYSSDHLADYAQAFARLEAAEAVYPCHCSRREISQHVVNANRPMGETLVYPGSCRNGSSDDKPIRNYRLKVPTASISFIDQLMGQQTDDLTVSVGDFAIMNGLDQYHYQLATVVDDEQQQISEIVRGGDLLNSTGRQIHLQKMLGYNRPTYLHLPVVTDRSGTKLSKQHGATAIDNMQASRNLISALNLLQQRPPLTLYKAGPGEILDWAITNWRTTSLNNFSAILNPI